MYTGLSQSQQRTCFSMKMWRKKQVRYVKTPLVKTPPAILDMLWQCLSRVGHRNSTNQHTSCVSLPRVNGNNINFVLDDSRTLHGREERMKIKRLGLPCSLVSPLPEGWRIPLLFSRKSNFPATVRTWQTEGLYHQSAVKISKELTPNY